MRANTTLDKMTTNKRASLVNLHKTDAFTFKWAFKALSLSLWICWLAASQINSHNSECGHLDCWSRFLVPGTWRWNLLRWFVHIQPHEQQMLDDEAVHPKRAGWGCSSTPHSGKHFFMDLVLCPGVKSRWNGKGPSKYVETILEAHRGSRCTKN